MKIVRSVRLANTISIKAGRTQYLAPEVFVGHAALPVNIWACVAVSYQLLSGHASDQKLPVWSPYVSWHQVM